LNFFERYKINDKQWPWVEDHEKWKKFLINSFKLLSFNMFVIMPLSMLTYVIKGKAVYSLDRNNLPDLFTILWQVLFFMLAEDTAFYWSHRFLHWDKVYPYIHKIHHEYKNTISIAAEHAHPVEYFSNILNNSFGPLLLGFGSGCHIVTYSVWLILRLGETMDGHCGYEFSWSPYRLLPFSGSSEYHNYHHINYKGNYCSLFTFWDRICGTVNPKYNKFHYKKAELSEKQAEKEKEIKKIN